MSHYKYSPVGYEYGQYKYCLDCIPAVVGGTVGYWGDKCNCAECQLDRIAAVRDIDRYNEASFSQDVFPKSIPYHNELHIDCEPESCNGRCARCGEVIDGICHLNGPDTCPMRDE